ncbi:hypothetical protein [Streptomyces sp. DSM 118148]|uniref:hypothetical protein n=1 Tax=Streptomyces sp. DSM 118148 TaxID=3448667 RepID=UPI00404006F5
MDHDRADAGELAEYGSRLHLAGRLPLDELIGNVRPLDEAAAAFEDLKSAVGARTVLEP